MRNRDYRIEHDLNKMLVTCQLIVAATPDSKHGRSDPLDGKVMIGKFVNRRVAKEPGTVEGKIRQRQHYLGHLTQ